MPIEQWTLHKRNSYHMRTLLISEVFPPKTGGSGRWFWEIYRRLPREEYFIAAGEDPRQAVFDETHDLQLKRVPLSMRSWGLRSINGLRGYWRAVRRLWGIIKRNRIDMVHCARCLPEGVMAVALRHLCGTPFVCYVHGEDINEAKTSRELAWLTRRVLERAAFVIPNSSNSQTILEQEWQLPSERISMLHPGVDTKKFCPANRDSDIRQRLGWNERTVILTVGRLQKRKGHDSMIKALPRIRESVPDVLYCIVGDGGERHSLEELMTDLAVENHVHFMGEITDETLVQCYQQCDLFALPNRQVNQDIEGFGMVLLEAQACGKPVLAGASGGTSETMRVPETGRIVDCTDIGQLSVSVRELLGQPSLCKSMGQLGRQWVVKTFDWESLSGQAYRLFRGETKRYSAVGEVDSLQPLAHRS